MTVIDPAVVIPFPAPAVAGDLIEIVPGIYWTQLPLPYQPGHVNTYLIDEGDGWCVVDAGLFDQATRTTWDRILENLPHRRTIKKVLITHWHSDHLGAAGWLCKRFDAPLLMSASEYLKGLTMEFMPRSVAGETERAFFLSHGLDADTTEEWVANGHNYLHMMAPLPLSYHRLVADNELSLGHRTFQIRTVPGHSPEQVILRSLDGDIYFCADQLGLKIAPNIAVQSADPLGDPLSLYLRSLNRIAADAPDAALMLAGHEEPFRGFDARASQLRAYHERRCRIVETACAEGPKSAFELVSHLFKRPPSPVWVGFIMSEAVTYANHLVRQGRLIREQEGERFRFAAARQV
jgi:glyoxylase-like metal-dependent hydrolase (beta-lactamase superfamily II)